MKALRNILARLLLAASLCATGCLSRQIARDGDSLREVLVTMYTDQAMDNLVRAHNNQGFVQLTYHDILNDDEDTYTGSAKATQTLTQTTPFAVAALSAWTRELINFLTMSGTAQRSRQMWFYARAGGGRGRAWGIAGGMPARNPPRRELAAAPPIWRPYMRQWPQDLGSPACAGLLGRRTRQPCFEMDWCTGESAEGRA
jgi:hypothetical protein